MCDSDRGLFLILKIFLDTEVTRRQVVEYPQDYIVYHQGRIECPADAAELVPTSLEKPYVGRLLKRSSKAGGDGVCFWTYSRYDSTSP